MNGSRNESFELAELGLGGLQFVRSRLATVKRCEGGVLDSAAPIVPLRAYAFSRDAAAAKSENDFKHSNSRYRQNAELTKGLIEAWLRQSPSGMTRVVSVEDRYETSATHLWKEFGEVLFEETPYLIVTLDEASAAGGVQLSVGGHEDVAILSEVPGPFAPVSELTRGHVDALAGGVVGAVVWAWDSEGAILASSSAAFEPSALEQS